MLGGGEQALSLKEKPKVDSPCVELICNSRETCAQPVSQGAGRPVLTACAESTRSCHACNAQLYISRGDGVTPIPLPPFPLWGEKEEVITEVIWVSVDPVTHVATHVLILPS